MANMGVFEGKKLSYDDKTNDEMSDDEAVASDLPPRYLFRYNCGPEQPRKQTEVLGHSLVHLLVRSYRSLIGKWED